MWTILGSRIFNFEATPTIEYLVTGYLATRSRPRTLLVTQAS